MKVDLSPKTPVEWVWRHLLKHMQLTTGQLHAHWARDRVALRKWKADPVTLEQALTSLRKDGMIACTNGIWWTRDVA